MQYPKCRFVWLIRLGSGAICGGNFRRGFTRGGFCRVEDTINLLGHAGRCVARCAAALLGLSYDQVCREAGCPLLLESSVKAGLDLDWGDPDAKSLAISIVIEQLNALEQWVVARQPKAANDDTLGEHINLVHKIIEQDLEPATGGGMQIKHEVAQDRRISITDEEMRHGRKTRSKCFNGFKRHVGVEMSTMLILAACVLPANAPEERAAPILAKYVEQQGLSIDELDIDRGYVTSPLVDEIEERGGTVRCRPWQAPNGQLYTKRDFDINTRDRTITCPAGVTLPIVFGETVHFPANTCGGCALRAKCTTSKSGCGRSVSISVNEARQQSFRELASTSSGRRELRKRIAVEHRQSRTCQLQGRKARYRGCRKNELHLRLVSAIANFQTIQRKIDEHSKQEFLNAA